MVQSLFNAWRLGLLLLLLLQSCGPENAPSQPAPPGDELEPVSLTLFTEKAELFMEYPTLVAGARARFLAHLTVLATGEPVTKGPVTLETTSPRGARREIVCAGPLRDGLFTPEQTFDEAGAHAARIVIRSPLLEDTIVLPDLVVHADEKAARAAAGPAEADPPDAIPFLLEQQWKIAMLLAPAERTTLVRRHPVTAGVATAPGRSAAASAPAAGRLARAPDGRWPAVGDTVSAGQVLGSIELPARDRSEISASHATVRALAIEIALRRFDLETKSVEAEQTLAEARVRADFSGRARERVARLRAKGLATQEDLERAELDLESARTAVQSAETLRSSVAGARERFRDVEKLSEVDSGPPAAGGVLPIVAPIAGRIAEARHTDGELVEEHEVLFRIVDLSTVRVECRVSEFEIASLPAQPGVLLFVPGRTEPIDVLAAGGRLVHVGTGVDPESRTVPIVYELPNPAAILRQGMALDARLETGRATDAVTIADEAVVMDHGRTVAYVLLGGESFQRREVTIGIQSGGKTEILAGVNAGERVATRGAYAIRLASLAPASFGHGHTH